MSRTQAASRSQDGLSGDRNLRSSTSTVGKTRPRRKSSGLSEDPRGDTSAPAVSTLDAAHAAAPMSPTLSPSSTGSIPRRSKRRKVRSFFRRWKHLTFTHTWANPLILICIILSLYAINPTSSNPLHRAIFLSYELPKDHPHIPAWARADPNAPAYYDKGRADFAFVSFYIVVLSFTREFLMQRLIRPIAIYNGIRSRAKQSRFMEQVYTAIYFSIFGPFGLYVMSRTPVWYFDTTAMYEDFPHKSHDALFKVYYLLQASYWAQQAIVLLLQLEKPRKDFKELVAHHIVTLALIWLSYRFHFTYMGLAVYITHDVSDFFLATSKTLNYLNSPITTPYFIFFTCIWIYCRHYINLRILYSITTTFVTVGDFTLNWETQQYKCRLSQTITFSLLALLQSINLFWLFLILRIAYSAAFKNVAKDTRSDDEEEEEEATEVENRRKQEIDELSTNGRARSSGADAGDRLTKVPEVRLNGSTVEDEQNETSYAGALKENRRMNAKESHNEAKKETLKNR